MTEVAHPLIVPLPRLVPPAGQLLRFAALHQLRARWRGPALELVLPSGEQFRLGAAARDAVPRATIHDDRLFLRMLLRGEMGAGESFVAGEWSTASSDELVAVLRAFVTGTAARGFESPLTRLAQLPALVRHRRAKNSRAGSARNIHAHYDLGNAFYQLFLDPETLAYSCAWFGTTPGAPAAPSAPSAPAAPTAPAASSRDLAAAQHAKHERLCTLLELRADDHLLEVGCGWGGMAIHAARTRGCRVTAITVSREQYELATARVAAAGLAGRVAIEFRDYRDLSKLGATAAATTSYSKIVSIEMLEAVGHEFLAGYFATLARVLAPAGRIALQSITMPDDRFAAYRERVDWMQTYIFPGSCIPSLAAIRAAAAPADLAITRADDLGPDYAPTLRAWRTRFVAALPEVRALGFDEPFIRTWLLYLAFSEAAFAERTLGDHQLVLERRR